MRQDSRQQGDLRREARRITRPSSCRIHPLASNTEVCRAQLCARLGIWPPIRCLSPKPWRRKLNIKRLMCSRQSFVPSRAPLEDNAFVLMDRQRRGWLMWTSAVNSGAMHSQKVRIVGEKASIEWWDEHPNQLQL